MSIKILEQGEGTTKLEMNGATYRITRETATVSRFFVSQWPYALGTGEWLEFVLDLRDADKTIYYDAFGPDIDLTYKAVCDVYDESWDGDQPHRLEWHDVMRDAR